MQHFAYFRINQKLVWRAIPGELPGLKQHIARIRSELGQKQAILDRRAFTSFGLVPQDFSHVSLAGKALLQYLPAEPLPGLEIL